MRDQPRVTESSFRLLLPDPEFEGTFRAYGNYLEDLAGLIAGRHGLAPTIAEGVYRAVEERPALARVKRRRPEGRRADALEVSLRRCWGNLRRVQGELAEDSFDEESNAWLPDMAYFAVFHALGALALASHQRHRRQRRFLSPTLPKNPDSLGRNGLVTRASRAVSQYVVPSDGSERPRDVHPLGLQQKSTRDFAPPCSGTYSSGP